MIPGQPESWTGGGGAARARTRNLSCSTAASGLGQSTAGPPGRATRRRLRLRVRLPSKDVGLRVSRTVTVAIGSKAVVRARGITGSRARVGPTKMCRCG